MAMSSVIDYRLQIRATVNEDKKKSKTEITASVQGNIKTHKRLKVNAFYYGLDNTICGFLEKLPLTKRQTDKTDIKLFVCFIA